MVQTIMTQIVISTQSLFDSIKRIDEHGTEYWSARDLQVAIKYSEWRHFVPTIDKAKIVCLNLGFNPIDHIEIARDVVEIGSGARREVESYTGYRFSTNSPSCNQKC